MRLIQRRRLLDRKRGTVLIVTMIVIFMISSLAVTLSLSSAVSSNAALEGRLRASALSAAESGVGLKMEELIKGSGAASSLVGRDYQLPEADVTVSVTDFGADGLDNDGDGVIDETDESVLRMVSTATSTKLGVQRAIEVFVRNEKHPAFYKALYAGNWSGDPSYELTLGADDGALRDPSTDSPTHTPDSNWETASHDNSGDYIEGDVYVNGGVNIQGDTDVFGDVDATGTIAGDVVDGTSTSTAQVITPPDLNVVNYDSIADAIVTNPSEALAVGWLQGNRLGNSSNYYGSVLSDSANHDRAHFHLGNQAGNLNISAADAGKLIVIKGNLWIHTTSSLTIDFPSGVNTHVTLVVEGNIYVADDIEYDPGSPDQGIMLIAKNTQSTGTDGESYVDTNMNYAWDPGEPILNDAGTIGTYEGPKEGQGNVFYGDPRYGTGGVTDGYLYAENNVYLVNEGTEGGYGADERVWGVQGFLSAGNEVLLGDRSSGSNYENFRVSYDTRFDRLDFKGIPGPTGGSYAGVQVVSWREIPPGTP